ncbi:High-molecular weight cobalt-containing nitrile hydratase subunit beta [bacterium HR25]|jgi:nitrile hydratase accessory protein|nr:High-molecular weight cobalt-containing nitrile hydratase subunit beta [bacterium HR25]
MGEAGVERVIANMEGAAALPRRNGELVFESPWESRAFGIAVALYQEGVVDDWEEFRRRLIEEIGHWEGQQGADQASWSYYERWLAALERLLVERGLLSAEEIEARARECRREDAHGH